MRRLVVLVALLLAIVALTPSVQARVRPAALSASHVPVVLVHGYNDRVGGCQGIDLATYWHNTEQELTTYVGRTASEVIPVSYYGCDAHGVDMTGSGPGTDFPLTRQVGTARPRAGVTNQASIIDIARTLAWFIHNEFAGQVYAVGHSMGGLVIREALRRVQAGDPTFPATLDIARVITFSTPYAGWEAVCTKNTECAEMTKGSTFLANLATNPGPQGASGTQWWAAGSNGTLFGQPCDIITPSSATSVAGTALVYTSPCYKHNEYLTDLKQTLDAQGSPDITGRHSLAMMGAVVS